MLQPFITEILTLQRTSQSSMRLIMTLKLLWKQNFYLRDIFRFYPNIDKIFSFFFFPFYLICKIYTIYIYIYNYNLYPYPASYILTPLP